MLKKFKSRFLDLKVVTMKTEIISRNITVILANGTRWLT